LSSAPPDGERTRTTTPRGALSGGTRTITSAPGGARLALSEAVAPATNDSGCCANAPNRSIVSGSASVVVACSDSSIAGVRGSSATDEAGAALVLGVQPSANSAACTAAGLSAYGMSASPLPSSSASRAAGVHGSTAELAAIGAGHRADWRSARTGGTSTSSRSTQSTSRMAVTLRC